MTDTSKQRVPARQGTPESFGWLRVPEKDLHAGSAITEFAYERPNGTPNGTIVRVMKWPQIDHKNRPGCVWLMAIALPDGRVTYVRSRVPTTPGSGAKAFHVKLLQRARWTHAVRTKIAARQR